LRSVGKDQRIDAEQLIRKRTGNYQRPTQGRRSRLFEEGNAMIQLPEMPPRIAALPRDDRGYPVPWFVHWNDGKPDFRIAGRDKREIAVTEKRCWVCGEQLGRWMAFVIGPMCAVNKTTSEPPCHLECAEFSAKACPFLTLPKAHRRDAGLPEEQNIPGFGIMRNPGCCLIWVCRGYGIFGVHNGWLIKLPPPERTIWYAEGRMATRNEVMESIDSGFPILRDMAQSEGDEAIGELNAAYKRAMELLPA
jgi:hypothetical protein